MINAIKQFIKSGRRFNKKDFGKLGELSNLSSSIILSNPKNIFIDDHVTIGSNAILYATNAKIIIKKYFELIPADKQYGISISRLTESGNSTLICPWDAKYNRTGMYVGIVDGLKN